MKKFMALYLSPVSAAQQMSQATPEQMQKGMAEWMKWKDKAGSAIVDLGSPLGNGKHIESGKTSAGKLAITGYSIVQAESTAHAEQLFQHHPHLFMPGAAIELLEYMPMPGM